MSATKRQRKSSTQISLFPHAAPDPEPDPVVGGKNKDENSSDTPIHSTALRLVQVRESTWLRRDPDEYRRAIRGILGEMRDARKDHTFLFREFERLDREIAAFLWRLPSTEEATNFERDTDAKWHSLLCAYEYLC